LLTAHILSAHASLEQKGKSIQNVKDQRTNKDRNKADLLMVCCLFYELSMIILTDFCIYRCSNLCNQILTFSEGDYASAKANVNHLCAELGYPPLPLLQSMLDKKAA
ncbi:hypothetical protein BT96DRAFT_785310, partial [Gymnopus androsaceus JB14]